MVDTRTNNSLLSQVVVVLTSLEQVNG
jgi:hypothetical protein